MKLVAVFIHTQKRANDLVSLALCRIFQNFLHIFDERGALGRRLHVHLRRLVSWVVPERGMIQPQQKRGDVLFVGAQQVVLDLQTSQPLLRAIL